MNIIVRFGARAAGFLWEMLPYVAAVVGVMLMFIGMLAAWVNA